MNLKEAVHINGITPQPERETRKISQTPTSGFVYENCYTIRLLTIKLNYYVEYLTVFEHSHKNVYHLSFVTHQYLLCTLQWTRSGQHLLHQISHSGRFQSLLLSSCADVPHSDLYFCRTPTSNHCWQLQYHWGSTSHPGYLHLEPGHVHSTLCCQSDKEVSWKIHQHCPRVQIHGWGW